jgi:hypothetical protein
MRQKEVMRKMVMNEMDDEGGRLTSILLTGSQWGVYVWDVVLYGTCMYYIYYFTCSGYQ